jgi:hypothetical protein
MGGQVACRAYMAYADAHRAFTNEEESELRRRIVEQYVNKGLYYCDQDFQRDAIEFFEELRAKLEQEAREDPLAALRLDDLPVFKASSRFIQGFRKRQRLSLRRPSFKRRPKVTEEQIESFVTQVQKLLERYPGDRIINIDETNWRTVAQGFLTWAETGVESVSCQLEDDEKAGVTVIAGITAAGTKLPLTVVGKGKTKRCLAGYELPTSVNADFSESGWTNIEVICRYFAFLRGTLFCDSEPLIVILDTYSAHRAQVVREIAQLWGITLIFIPPGCTDRLQPLDRRVFGVLKAYAREQWRRAYHATGGGKTKRKTIAENLVAAWERITDDVLAAAWDIYGWGTCEEGAEPETDDDGEYQMAVTLDDLRDLV